MKRGPPPSPMRKYVLALYRRGELATLDEGALLADVSRQRVRAWLAAAGIRWEIERQRFLAKQRSRIADAAAGITRRRPSKSDMRRTIERLTAQRE